ncbi:MAG: putative lipid II flippase FtsW, partial [Acidobacteria bacterium]|nr:putative lipid II flippase FtsW [Acidobacteriota bacterium]
LFLATLLLLCLSVVMVYSASAQLALERFRQPAYLFLTKQFLWIALGVSLLAIVMRIDYRLYRQPAFFWALAALAIVALIAVLFSPPVKGARRWFSIGGIGIQPSELAKLAVIIFVAAVLERRAHRVNDLGYSLPPIALVLGVMLALIYIEPDFGTAMAILLIAGIMIFAAGLSYTFLLTLTLAAVPIAAMLLLRTPYRRQRLLAFLDPWSDPLQEGFQIIQSWIAIGSGGLFGRGLMSSVQKLFYLPEPHTDFIYAVVAEELGLLGATGVLLCFCVIAWRGFRTAATAPDAFGGLLAVGVTTMIVVQALLNMSVVLGLLPTKGIPLPLVSAGGSSLVINLLGIGVLLNVSQQASAAR